MDPSKFTPTSGVEVRFCNRANRFVKKNISHMNIQSPAVGSLANAPMAPTEIM